MHCLHHNSQRGGTATVPSIELSCFLTHFTIVQLKGFQSESPNTIRRKDTKMDYYEAEYESRLHKKKVDYIQERAEFDAERKARELRKEWDKECQLQNEPEPKSKQEGKTNYAILVILVGAALYLGMIAGIVVSKSNQLRKENAGKYYDSPARVERQYKKPQALGRIANQYKHQSKTPTGSIEGRVALDAFNKNDAKKTVGYGNLTGRTKKLSYGSKATIYEIVLEEPFTYNGNHVVWRKRDDFVAGQ